MFVQVYNGSRGYSILCVALPIDYFSSTLYAANLFVLDYSIRVAIIFSISPEFYGCTGRKRDRPLWYPRQEVEFEHRPYTFHCTELFPSIEFYAVRLT
jgi:hypothetical protein